MQYGHFDNEKREYVIDRVDLPVSWREGFVRRGQSYGGRLHVLSVSGVSPGDAFSRKCGADGPAGTLCVSEGCKGRRLLEHFLAAGGQTAGSGKIHLQTRHELHNL